MKKLTSLILAVCMLSALFVPLAVGVVTAASINDNSVFVKQQASNTCTLAAATMMFRRKAILNGDSGWDTITESNLRPVAWTSSLRWKFAYRNISADCLGVHSDLKMPVMTKDYLIAILANHPEGIVIWHKNPNQHAVLLTDYDRSIDTFYCADPANSIAAGRIPFTSARWTGTTQEERIAAIHQFWYVTGESLPDPANPIPPCSHPSYDDKGMCTNAKCSYQFPYDTKRDISVAGTYKVKSGVTAYIRKGPYQGCDEITHTKTGTFKVVAKVYNAKNNWWYEIDYKGSRAYVVSDKLSLVEKHLHCIGTECEAAHPHKVYQMCSDCEWRNYTGATQKVSGCTQCYPEVCSCSTSYAGTYTCTAQSSLSIRSGHGTSYGRVGYIPYGASVTVTKSNGAWAHVTYGGVSGYVSMDYLSKKEATCSHTYVTEYELAHPHKQYTKCTKCGVTAYTGQTTTMASCAECVPSYTVTFLGKDGAVLKTQTVKKGSGATAPTPPEVNGYVFAGWSAAFNNVQFNLTVRAQYQTVEESGSPVLRAESVTAYPGKTVEVKVKVANNPGICAITVSYGYNTEVFEATIEKGEVSKTFSVTAGKNHIYKQNEGTNVTQNGTFAVIKLKVADNAPLGDYPIDVTVHQAKNQNAENVSFRTVRGNVKVNSTPTLQGVSVSALPGKTEYLRGEALDLTGGKLTLRYSDSSTEEISLTDPAVTVNGFDNTVLGKQRLTVNYKEKTCTFDVTVKVQTYTVTFVGKDGTVLKTETVGKGASAAAPSAPAVEGYTFTGWDKSFQSVTKNLTVRAMYSPNTYTVTFKGSDGSALKTETVKHGFSATAPVPPRVQGRVFKGWDKEFDAVKGDLVVTALYAVCNGPTLVASNAVVAPGGTVVINVEMVNNPGVAAMIVTYGFDKEVFEATIEQGDVGKGFNVTAGTNHLYNQPDGVNVTKNGTFAVIKLKVAKDAPLGNYNFEIKVRQAKNDAHEFVDFEGLSGEITVKKNSGFLYGDADASGEIDLADVIILCQHLADFDWDTGESSVEVASGADANGDGAVDLADVILLCQYLADFDWDTGESSVVLGPKA